MALIWLCRPVRASYAGPACQPFSSSSWPALKHACTTETMCLHCSPCVECIQCPQGPTTCSRHHECGLHATLQACSQHKVSVLIPPMQLSHPPCMRAPAPKQLSQLQSSRTGRPVSHWPPAALFTLPKPHMSAHTDWCCCGCTHACSSLDADGFPTADSQLAAAVGLQQEASDPNEGLAEAQMLLLEQQEDGLYDEDGTASIMSGATHQVRRGASRVLSAVLSGLW